MIISAQAVCDDGRLVLAKVNVKENNGITAVFVDFAGNSPLSADSGVRIVINGADGIKAFVAQEHHNEWWCRPFFGEKLCEMPADVQAIIAEKHDGNFLVMIPAVGKDYKCRFGGGEGLTASVFSLKEGMTACRTLAFVYAEGRNPYELISRCFKTILSETGNDILTREERAFPEIFQYLGWCSWDALQIRVSEEGLLAKSRELKEKNIPVKWFIVDDMWAEIKAFHGASYSGLRDMVLNVSYKGMLYSFDGDKERFPDGMKGCMGYNIVMYYAALMGVSPEYFEAAKIDGAGKLKQIWYISLPMIKDIIIILLILNVGKIMHCDFGLFYNVPLNISLLRPTTDVLDTYVYRTMIQLGDVGMSAAAAFFQSVVGFFLVVATNIIVKRVDQESGLF